jgi:hypothetical protein
VAAAPGTTLGLPSSQGPPPPSTARRWIGPLFAYHLLILAGAVVLVLGVARGSQLLIDVGSIVIGSGVSVQLWVLYVTGKLARQGPPVTVAAVGGDHPPDSSGRWLCPACGWRTEGATRNCPRCGKFLIRLPPRTAPASLATTRG